MTIPKLASAEDMGLLQKEVVREGLEWSYLGRFVMRLTTCCGDCGKVGLQERAHLSSRYFGMSDCNEKCGER